MQIFSINNGCLAAKTMENQTMCICLATGVQLYRFSTYYTSMSQRTILASSPHASILLSQCLPSNQNNGKPNNMHLPSNRNVVVQIFNWLTHQCHKDNSIFSTCKYSAVTMVAQQQRQWKIANNSFTQQQESSSKYIQMVIFQSIIGLIMCH